MIKKILIPFFALIAGLVMAHSSYCEEGLELYAIKYGESGYPSKYIYHGDRTKRLLDFAWMFYLIKYRDKTILVDTGFSDRRMADAYHVDHTNPLTILRQMGVPPEDVTDVIITHSHFDHIGNVDKFPEAHIYIQEDELDGFLRSNKNVSLNGFFHENRERIRTFDTSFVLLDFFHITRIGGHTVGSSVVSFKHNNREYVLVGDECYLLDNYVSQKPIGTYYDIQKNKMFLAGLKKIPGVVVLTFHDPSIVGKMPFKRII